MAINFPTNLDTLTNPAATDNTATVSHAGQHADANDAIEALEAKVGKNSSAVTTSHDYKLSEVTSTDKAVGKSATQDLTNKTLGTGTKVTIGSDATGDIWYRHSDGTIKRLAADEGKILKIVGGVPTYATETTVADASTTVKGVVEEATLAEIDANTAAGGTSARLFVNPSTLGKSTDTTLADNSDAKIPSQKAVKTYVDNAVPKIYSASDTLVSSADTERTTASGSFTKGKEIVIGGGGTLRIKFDLKTNGSGGTAHGRIYINGVAVGTDQTNATGTYSTLSQDISSIKGGDLIQLYYYIDSGTGALIRNFRLYGTVVSNGYTINTD